MANGKAKGSSWERFIAKSLTVWLTGQEKPYCYWRTPSSGALQTISGADSVSGDIVAIRPEGKFLTDIFSIEAKVGYPHADFFKHFKESRNEIKDFWLQCVNDAKKSNKFPMLIFKKSGLKPIIGIDFVLHLGLSNDLLYSKSLTLSFDDKTPSVVFFDMEMFFKIITPDMIKEIKIR